jgi:hypothetical protein
VKFLHRARRTIFGISLEEARIKRRGFHPGNAAVSARLERVGLEFLGGYHTALEEASVNDLAARLNSSVEEEFRGFAFEGAAMALTLLDRVHLHRGSFREFAEGPGAAHTYMLHVGAGWAFARLPWVRRRLDRAMASLDPVLRWLAIDGYGFHEGYFYWPRTIRQHLVPAAVNGYARRAFDQGLGRSLWFVEGADSGRVACAIASFPQSRRSDLWAGIGLACTYAGGADASGIHRLREHAGPDATAMAQGAAFAAEARRRAGNLTENCEAACRVLCGMTAGEAASLALAERENLPPDGEMPAYEVWRQRLEKRFAAPARPAEALRIPV